MGLSLSFSQPELYMVSKTLKISKTYQGGLILVVLAPCIASILKVAPKARVRAQIFIKCCCRLQERQPCQYALSAPHVILGMYSEYP